MRGLHVFNAILDDLTLKFGLGGSKKVVLSGTSAGGLATALRCDDLKYERFANDLGKEVKCLVDTGIFTDAISIYGGEVIRSEYQSLIELQKPKGAKFCSASESDDDLSCFFPEYFLHTIRTDTLVIQPLYDFWQTVHVWFPEKENHLPADDWYECANNLGYCDESQRRVVEVYRFLTEKSLRRLIGDSSHSYFLHSCHVHGQVLWGIFDEIFVGEINMKAAVSKFMRGERVGVLDEARVGENPSCNKFVH